MYPEILKATYSAKDCAFALQHGAFTNFRRDLTRGGFLFFPRKTAPGPGGGEYRYAHVVEMAIHMTIGSSRDRHLSRSVVWGLHNLMMSTDYGLKKLNADQKLMQTVSHGESGFEDGDFPPGTPFDAAKLVDFAAVFLAEDQISRDLENPDYLIYDIRAHKQGAAKVELIKNMDLGDAYARIVEMHTENASDEQTRQILAESAWDMPIFNLTYALVAIDRRLKFRLDAQAIRGA